MVEILPAGTDTAAPPAAGGGEAVWDGGHRLDPLSAKWAAEFHELARTLPYEEPDGERSGREIGELNALLATAAVAPHYGRYVVFHRGRILGSRPDPIQAEVELGREYGINPLNLRVAKAYDPDGVYTWPDDYY